MSAVSQLSTLGIVRLLESMKPRKKQSPKGDGNNNNQKQIVPTHPKPFISKRILGGGIIISLFLAFFSASDGHWDSLWVKGFILFALVLATIAIYEQTNVRIKRWYIASIPAFLFCVFSGGIIIYLYSYYAQWMPPELPKGCKMVYITFGNCSVGVSPSVSKMPNIVNVSGVSPIMGHVKYNRFYVSVDLPGPFGVIKIRDQNIANRSIIPVDWDCNSSSNAVEIVNESNLPILQVFYRKPEQIVVRGIFVVGKFCVYGDENSMTMGTYHPSKPSGLPSEFYLKPLFKYPSWNHRGDFAD